MKNQCLGFSKEDVEVRKESQTLPLPFPGSNLKGPATAGHSKRDKRFYEAAAMRCPEPGHICS